MNQDFWLFEKEAGKKGYKKIAGIDEAVRGPLAGPVVSAAIILPKNFCNHDIDDSKKISPKKREYLSVLLFEEAESFGIGMVHNAQIDRINILQSSLLSMKIAVENLSTMPDFLLVDGINKIASNIPQKSIPKGDSLRISIAAASIIAKVTRDQIMEVEHKKYPEYGFNKHKGYPTKQHKKALKKFGPCSIHRYTFKGVKDIVL
mmetsp:Transcript_5062/g.2836  ORF Transcript_5062/g.2836 Transcript_5062/m.2836 type:complete len:204 (+) Transcript_5062:4226-4837(+)